MRIRSRCARCFSLQNYGKVRDEGVESQLPTIPVGRVVGQRASSLKGRSQTLLCVVDLADFAGSLPADVIGEALTAWEEGIAPRATGRPVYPRIVVVSNKADLLPRVARRERLTAWVRGRWRAAGLPEPHAVFVVSARVGFGVTPLREALGAVPGAGRGDVWVIGAQNAGKSSLINALQRKGAESGHDSDAMPLDPRLTQEEGTGKRQESAVEPPTSSVESFRPVTEAAVPGTTLGLIRLDDVLPSRRCRVWDTPGFENPVQLSSTAFGLSPEEVRMLLPKRSLKPRSFRAQPGQALALGGLARVEVTAAPGQSVYLTVWASDEVALHLGPGGEKARELQRKFSGSQLVPPVQAAAASVDGASGAVPAFPGTLEMTPCDVTVSGESWKQSSEDIHIAGLGWVGVGVSGRASLRVWTWEGAGVTVQPSLMPDISSKLERPGFATSNLGQKKSKAKSSKKGRGGRRGR